MDAQSKLPLNPKDLLILLTLAERSMHGYGILKSAEEQSKGRVRLDPANLYRALQRLERDGLVEDAGEGRSSESEGAPRRYHRLTPFGRKVAEAESARLARQVRRARQQRLLGSSRRA